MGRLLIPVLWGGCVRTTCVCFCADCVCLSAHKGCVGLLCNSRHICVCESVEQTLHGDITSCVWSKGIDSQPDWTGRGLHDEPGCYCVCLG